MSKGEGGCWGFSDWRGLPYSSLWGHEVLSLVGVTLQHWCAMTSSSVLPPRAFTHKPAH